MRQQVSFDAEQQLRISQPHPVASGRTIQGSVLLRGIDAMVTF